MRNIEYVMYLRTAGIKFETVMSAEGAALTGCAAPSALDSFPCPIPALRPAYVLHVLPAPSGLCTPRYEVARYS